MVRLGKRILCLILTVLCLIPLLHVAAFGAGTSVADTVSDIAEGIIQWKKSDNGASPDGSLINDTYLQLAGTTPGDWYPIGLGRLGVSDAYDAYLAVIRDQVCQRYAQPGKLSAAKATEWHRISLAVLASGGDPTDMGNDGEGNRIDLIADGTYNRGKTTSLGRQGINGWIWGLITLDSMRYEVPQDAFNTREDIIIEILRQQLTDGGFALSGAVSDPDITAMAIQALTPYYNDEKSHTYTRKATKETVTYTVRQVVDTALDCLSALQTENGDFRSWGTENAESTAQVTVALCCLGIDPLTDPRFVKNGNTLLDGMLRYRMADGGFVHSFTYDKDNPTSLPDRSNSMAGEQVLYTMAALQRLYGGMRSLYDFRPEMSQALRERIDGLCDDIAALTDGASDDVLRALLSEFYALPETERCYVTGYWKLSDLAVSRGIDVRAIVDVTEVRQDTPDSDSDDVLLYFSASDMDVLAALPERLTTEQYVTVTTLLDKLDRCEDFAEKTECREKLTAAKAQIEAISAEIDAVNAEILDKLYPFESISLSDKKTVDGIVARYQALSEYDRAKILHYEDVVKTKTAVDNLLRGILIGIVLTVSAAVTLTVVIVRLRRRRRRRARAMEELEAMYADEDGGDNRDERS